MICVADSNVLEVNCFNCFARKVKCFFVEDESLEKGEDSLREQDRFLPIANVARIMKRSIPHTGKVSYDDATS